MGGGALEKVPGQIAVQHGILIKDEYFDKSYIWNEMFTTECFTSSLQTFSRFFNQLIVVFFQTIWSTTALIKSNSHVPQKIKSNFIHT
eukprot:UN00812